MKTKTAKTLALALLLIATMSLLTACGAKLPGGQYTPVDSNAAAALQSITISGNNFTVVIPAMGAETSKYTYNKKTGAITLTDGMTGFTSFEYKNGSIWLVSAFGNVEFTKTN